MDGAFVFIGPTLASAEAQDGLPDATLLPPARRGDIARLVLQERPAVLVLIDGLCNSVPAVVHKEILFALKRGVRVFGAASMGALRAAELWMFGMEGVGEIFERFKAGMWDADDEVAVAHGPAELGFRAGSVSLANIRLALETACDRRLIERTATPKLVAEAKNTFYPDRCWRRVFATARSIGVEEQQVRALEEFVAHEAPNAQRDDALEALGRVRAMCESGEPSLPPKLSFDFEPTIYWDWLVREISPVAATNGRDADAVVTYPQLERDVRIQPDAREIRRGAALLHLLLTRQSDDANPHRAEEVQLALDRFRWRRGLHTTQQAEEFYRAQELTLGELRLLGRLEVELDRLAQRDLEPVSGLFALELKRRGAFADVKQRVAQKQRFLEEHELTSLSLADLGLTLGELLEWYQTEFETIEGPMERHAHTLGFMSVREFLAEVMLEHGVRGREERRVDHLYG